MKMKIKELIQKLEKFDPEDDANLWMKWWVEGHKNRILHFEEAGKVVRLLMPILGKPTSETSYSYGVKAFGWPSKTDKPLSFLQAEALLAVNGFFEDVDYDRGYIGPAGYSHLKVAMSSDYYYSSFYTSDDPEVWKAKQKKQDERKKIRAVEKKLDNQLSPCGWNYEVCDNFSGKYFQGYFSKNTYRVCNRHLKYFEDRKGMFFEVSE